MRKLLIIITVLRFNYALITDHYYYYGHNCSLFDLLSLKQVCPRKNMAYQISPKQWMICHNILKIRNIKSIHCKKNVCQSKGSSIIVIIFTSVQSVRWGGGSRATVRFLNVVYSDGNEIIAHVRRTSMTKNSLVRNS